MYRWLLRLYPASFRDEYGGEMHAVFRRRRRDVRTPFGLAALYLGAVADTVANAAIVHWDILRQDLRSSARTLRRAPGFALTVVVIAGLGIGATTAAFSITDFVLLRPLPFPDADRLVTIWERPPGYARNELSPANYRDWKRLARSFDAFAAYRGWSVSLVGTDAPRRLDGAAITADLLPALGASPLIGRPIADTDDRDGAPGVVLLSYRFWQSDFGGDAGVLGRTLTLDDRSYTVVGVMPPWFQYPNRDAVVWTAMQFAPGDFDDRTNTYLHTIARLRPGASLASARAEMDVLAAQFKRQYPVENGKTDVSVFALRDEVSPQSRLALLVLSTAAASVLLIACANLVNLLLARALGRRQEVAVRAALGAGRERLVHQLLTESFVLAGIGGVLGIALAAIAVPVLSQLVPTSLPVADIPSVELRTLLFAVLTTVVTGTVFGLAPMLSASGSRATAALREGARAGGGRRERSKGERSATSGASSSARLSPPANAVDVLTSCPSAASRITPQSSHRNRRVARIAVVTFPLLLVTGNRRLVG